MSQYIVKCLKTYLKSPLTTSATTVVLRELLDSKSNTVALADFGSYGVIAIKQGDSIEMIKFSGLSRASDGTVTLTVATNGRHIAPTQPYAGGSTGLAFQSGAEVIVTNDPLTMSQFGNLNNAQTWSAVQTFSVAPVSSADAVASNEVVRKSQLDSAVLGSLTVTPVVVPATGGETIAIDQLLYLKVSDGEWYLIDADTAATVDNIVLGISRGAGSDGVAITGGVTILGEHTASSAIFTANTKYYCSNTAGGFSTTAGTNEVTVGYARTTTKIIIYPRYDQMLTEDQQDALAGVSAPSASNKFATQAEMPPTGMVVPYAGFSAPTGWLLANGGAVSRTTYSTLFELLNPSLGTVTLTIASPSVFSLTAHGLVLDDIVYLTTTGALPTGFSVNTRYYVVSGGLTADAFELSATKGGSAINGTGSQSGVHTLRRSPYGVGDGSTTFNVPSLLGAIPVGRDSTQTEFNAVGETGGEKTHTLTTAEMPSHTHTYGALANVINGTGQPGFTNGNTYTSGSAGSDGAHNNLQPYIALNYIIKT